MKAIQELMSLLGPSAVMQSLAPEGAEALRLQEGAQSEGRWADFFTEPQMWAQQTSRGDRRIREFVALTGARLVRGGDLRRTPDGHPD